LSDHPFLLLPKVLYNTIPPSPCVAAPSPYLSLYILYKGWGRERERVEGSRLKLYHIILEGERREARKTSIVKLVIASTFQVDVISSNLITRILLLAFL